MRDILLLMRVHTRNTLGFNKAIHGKSRGEKTKMVLFACLLALAGLLLLGVSTMYSAMIAYSLYETNAPLALLPAIMMAVSSCIALFTTIYKAGGILFAFRDYDLLMSLPLRSKTVVLSRICILYSMNILFTLVVMVPAGVVYAVMASPPLWYYLFFVLTLFLLPVVPVLVATVIGTLVTAATARFRHKNALTLVFTMAVMVAVVFGSMNMGAAMENIADFGSALMKIVDRVYPLTGVYTRAVCQGDLLSFALFVGISLVAMAVYVWVVGRKFGVLHSMLTGVGARSNYKLTRLKQGSPGAALCKKEIRRYFSSPVYVLNTGIGLVLMTVFSIAVTFLGADQLEEILDVPMLGSLVGSVAPLFISLFVTMTYTTACSISLEGKNFWLLRSLPIATRTVLWSKIALNLLLILPVVALNTVILAIGLRADALQTALLFFTPAAYALFISVIGQLLNLLFPNFGWTNETAVIKQSAPAFLTMLAGFLGIAAVGFSLFAFRQFGLPVVLAIATLALFVLTVGLIAVLHTWGVRKFEKL